MIPIYLQKRWQKTQWNKLKNSAGPRYTSEVDVGLPLKELFEGLGRTDIFFTEIKELKDALQKASKDLDGRRRIFKKDVQDKIPKISKYSKIVIKVLDEIIKDSNLILPFNKISPTSNLIFKHIRAIYDVVNKLEDEESEAFRLAKQSNPDLDKIGYQKDSEYLSSLKFLRNDLRKLSSVLVDVDTFSKSLKAKLSNEPFVFLLGEAGMGKTHMLCDVTKKRLENGYLTIIVLGEEISKLSRPVKSIIDARNIKDTETNFLNIINTIGKRRRRRVLLIVDAVNESDIEGWKKKLKKFKEDMKKYPWVGVVLSCRTPFENIIIPKKLKVHREYHRGFNDFEFEAMKAYFKHYRIPLPEVPVLISEFSSPLFLSSFCRTAISLRDGRGKVAKKVRDIALGQAGMTTILEDFYVSKQSEIFKKESLNFSGIITQDWLWDKISGKECLMKLFAKTMASNGKEFLFLDEAVKITGILFQNKHDNEVYKEILNMLIHYGALIKDLTYLPEISDYKEVIKFPFQKFSDHLIARYFLENHLNVNKLKKCFEPSSALGSVFKSEETLYSRVNLAEAIIVEFTERIKRNSRVRDKDIVYYLSKNVITSPIFRQIYISALYWRRPDNFLNSSGDIKKSTVNYFNKVLLRYQDSSKGLLNFLVTTAVKPKHPLNQKILFNWLQKMTMQRRDIFWTEYLRNSHESDPIYRLVSWIEEHDISKISEEHAEAVIGTLLWSLTTTSHPLRNRVTKSIYIVGAIWPEVCFQQTLKSLSIDDLYVRERMLAVSYGVTMRHRVSKKYNDFIKIFSQKIFESFFAKNAKFSSTHVYIRNYARGIVELSLHKKLLELSRDEIARIRPPYKDGGIRRWGKSEDLNKGEYRDGNAPLGMDFENYTLGCLVQNRSNYDFTNKEYIKVRANILWRLYKIGYSLKAFGDIDKQIVSSQRITRSDYPTKIDRYGKKYSWIAYYELMGFRADKKLINSYFDGDSYRESENDIDPSFPLIDLIKFPIEPNLLKGPRNMKKWLKDSPAPDLTRYLQFKNNESDLNDWMLVDGTIGQLDEKNEKRNNVFISGVFVKKDNRDKLCKLLEKVEYFGDENIPNNPEVRAEYLGELGWHPDYIKPDKSLVAKFVIGYKKVKINRKFYPTRINKIVFEDKKELTIEMPDYREEAIYEKINIRRLSRYCSSKDYRKIGYELDGLGLYIPSNTVIKVLNLHKDPGSYNFLDKDGKLATRSFVEGGQYKTHKNLLYIRKDLLEKLKKKYNMDFFLCAEGERQYWSKNSESIYSTEFSTLYQERKNQHRQFIG